LTTTAIILAGSIGAGSARASSGLDVTMEVIGPDEDIRGSISQVIPLPEQLHEQGRRDNVNDKPGDHEESRNQHRYEARENVQEEAEQVREQTREMHQESQEQRQEIREQVQELRQETQEQSADMREESEEMRDQTREMRQGVN
jgi:uncharacterized protein (DUF3084 family)